MKLRPEELETEHFQLLNKLEHKELIPFVRIYIRKKTKAVAAYYLASILPALALSGIFYNQYRSGSFDLDLALSHLGYGFALAFTLIPLHEYIHVLAYKSVGALHTSYDANLKRFYFMAMADQFVASRKEFRRVALAPFIVISALLCLLIFFTDTGWNITLLGILLTHSSFCGGDFALLSYFEFHSDREVVTFDDKKNKISYFYGREFR